MRRALAPLVISLVSCLLLASDPWAPDAWARGGRFSGPSSNSPSSSAAPAPATSEEPAPACPEPEPSPEVSIPSPVPSDTAAPSMGGARRVVASKTPGIGDWMYWYEANREQFEDLRSSVLVTEANPLFAVGAAAGARAGVPEHRLDDATMRALRDAIHAVLGGERDEHWIFTEGAAYVALGKIAAKDTDVERLLQPLQPEANVSAYLRESAVLGLGQLRRTQVRRQLPDTTLDHVRTVLLGILEDVDEADRTRAFAAVSLGLLSDQPTADDLGGVRTSQDLLATLLRRDVPDETQVGVLVGLGLHRPADVTAVARAALLKVARDGRLGKRVWTAPVRAQAVVTLGRVGAPSAAGAVLELLSARRGAMPALTQGAVLAAGLLGGRHHGTRIALAKGLVEAATSLKEPTARARAWMALGRVLAAEARDGAREALVGRGIREPLFAALRSAPQDERAFAGLGLALAARAVDPDLASERWQSLRGEGFAALQRAVLDASIAPHTRAAMALALGLTRERRGAPRLMSLAASKDTDPELRAYAALGLGLLGDARRDVILALTQALRDARSDRLRMNAATALGLLGGGSAKDRERSLRTLLVALRATRNKHVKGRIAITLARIGDSRAVRPLRDVLRTGDEQPMSRAVACAALGLIGDEETTPVLSAARRDCFYLSGSSVMFEILDTL